MANLIEYICHKNVTLFNVIQKLSLLKDLMQLKNTIITDNEECPSNNMYNANYVMINHVTDNRIMISLDVSSLFTNALLN